MTQTNLAVGSDAPDFDLTSTEDVLLMLRDEVPRTALVLYVFLEIDDDTRADLQALAAQVPGWAEDGIKVLAMAPIKVAQLKQLQVELQSPFPLLEDDRDFCVQYGVSAPEVVESEEEGIAPSTTDQSALSRRLVLVDRHCKIGWSTTDWNGIAEALAGLKQSDPGKQSELVNYPGQVLNKLVSWWVS